MDEQEAREDDGSSAIARSASVAPELAAGLSGAPLVEAALDMWWFYEGMERPWGAWTSINRDGMSRLVAALIDIGRREQQGRGT